MIDLLLSPLRRVGGRARSSSYIAAIKLARQGLFWPAAVVATALLGWVMFALFDPRTGSHSQYSGLILLVVLASSWALRSISSASAVLADWTACYSIIAVPTLIWASQPGLGMGVRELAYWIVLFGIALFIAAAVIGFMRDRDVAQSAALPGIGIGYVVGLIVFVWKHGVSAHPDPGGWWVAPLFSATGAIIAMLTTSPRIR